MKNSEFMKKRGRTIPFRR